MKRVITILSICAIMIFAGAGCKERAVNYKVHLDVWGTFDNSNAFDDVFNEYRSINKNIAMIDYRKHTLESYKKDVLNALASGTGPDIFMIHNSWMPDFIDKIVPVPTYMMTESDLHNNFVDVVAHDAVIGGQIYGVAPSVDSLALYYNKDMFNAAGITRPPATWDELDAIVPQLTVVDESGAIAQSAISLGTSYNADGTINVNRAPDIVTALMIQHGAEMSRADDARMTFGESFSGTNNGASVPGERALHYYTRFSTLGSDVYTWNKRQNYSIDEFVEGRVAMTINYSYHYDTIKAKNAKLNFATADLPQRTLDTVGSQANYANYWLFVVAKNKQPIQPNDPKAVQITNDMRVHESWQLLKSITFPSANGFVMANYITYDPLSYVPSFDFTEKYLEATGKPAARRDLIEKQKTDVRLGAFARGNLIARTWWRHDADAVDGIFYDMIDRVNTGQMSVFQSLQLGQQRAQQLQ